MRKPEWITFTGVDDQTDIVEMEDISRRYAVEWGILFSPKRQGVDARYPTLYKLNELRGLDIAMAAHLCGEYTRRIMNRDRVVLPVQLTMFTRFQINHTHPDPEIIKHFYFEHGRRCIAQTRDLAFPASTMVHWLYDPSGGRGTRSKVWPPHPGHERLVGYAGGIGPENVKDVLSEIDSDGPYWIDMESRVRTDDRFDLSLCRKVCEAVYG